MRKALTASAVLHLAVLLLAVLVVPMFDEKLDLEPSMIPIDIVDVGPVASPRQGEARPEPPPAATKPVASPPAEALPPPPPPRAPEPKPAPPPPTPKPAPPPPTPKPAPPPPTPKPAPPPPEPKAEVPDQPKPHEKPQPPKPEPPKPEPPKPPPPKPPEKKAPEKKPPETKPEKPVEKPPEKKPVETDPLASVLSHVADLAKKQPPAPAPQPSPAKPSSTSGSAPLTSDRLTGPQEDALRSQIGHCWNVDPGARNAKDMVIDVVIEVNPDRTVAKADIAEKSKARMYTDPAYRAAAEAALRAVRNPRCQPLALPPEKYDTWRRITFTFNPKDML